ncbi:hypothetical protein NDI37_12170 [Funiculus sociatus GB2-A5]|uniref:Uncharacterized protein n=1 Tax=Funiculus sociatus GB2-A5 TaxID=2933946 RepID=A0ABV0JRE7_9CYAN|nr:MULTISPECIES: hypothetical protein [unclassified Trichocoleus]MBD1907912.1 hypothetical protein [Trichocoleus sp. FACHB-832]MBD2064771.1 hypothetical protein [Trichocoleus sp. FACHB-6]
MQTLRYIRFSVLWADLFSGGILKARSRSLMLQSKKIPIMELDGKRCGSAIGASLCLLRKEEFTSKC